MSHAIDMLLHSELFVYHDARMVGIMMADAQEVGHASYPRDDIETVSLTNGHRTHIRTSYTSCITLCRNTAIVTHHYSSRIASGRSCCRPWARLSVSSAKRCVFSRLATMPLSKLLTT